MRNVWGVSPNPAKNLTFLDFPLLKNIKSKQSVEGSLRENFPQAGLGLESRARCAGFSAMEIGKKLPTASLPLEVLKRFYDLTVCSARNLF